MTEIDEEDRALMHAVREYLEHVNVLALHDRQAGVTALRDVVGEFLGTDAALLPVEIPLPSERERERLLQLYAGRLALSDAALHSAAERTDRTTGSFAKEVVRATVMRAAVAGHEPNDDDLSAALDELLGTRRALTRSMLGGAVDHSQSGSSPHDQSGAGYFTHG